MKFQLLTAVHADLLQLLKFVDRTLNRTMCSLAPVDRQFLIILIGSQENTLPSFILSL
jgi:hypothetical protein